MADAASLAGGSDALMGKGAWDCDAGVAIPPDKEAEVFEEVPTMDFPFHGMPTVPPRKDMSHMAFFCRGVRYRVTAFPDWTAARVKAALWAGGLGKAPSSAAAGGGGGGSTAAPPQPPRRPPSGPDDYTLVYAGRAIPDGARLADCGVPPGCQALIAIESARLEGPPSPTSPYWD